MRITYGSSDVQIKSLSSIERIATHPRSVLTFQTQHTVKPIKASTVIVIIPFNLRVHT